jgi:hypothetical protein
LIEVGVPATILHDPEKREALFDLLTLSIYADAHVSLTEERLVESAFIAEGWESEYPKSLFIEGVVRACA